MNMIISSKIAQVSEELACGHEMQIRNCENLEGIGYEF